MIFSCVSQVNIHAGKTGPLGVALAENERTSGQQQQDRRNDKKQFFQKHNLQFKYSVPSWDTVCIDTNFNPTMRSISRMETCLVVGFVFASQIGTDYRLSPGVVVINLYSSVWRGMVLTKGTMEPPMRSRP